jgi:transcriptional regulator with GAF, ATPase, and Fis domain
LLADDNRYLQEELGRITGDEIIGADFGLKGVMEMVRQVALLNSPVILFGETGTGKEVIARAIHNLSGRREGPFIKVNCGAIPDSLMDSELFGHEKGAFTGALSQKRGRFERAGGGTIFLDEIGELPLEAQVRLLRVLQEKEIERIGGTQPIKVDIRVIAATHRNLQKMIHEGKFREDLFYRLQVFPISMILSKDEPLSFSDLKPLLPADKGQATGPADDASLKLYMVIGRHIRTVLEMAGGRVEGQGGAAELFGVNPGTLRHRMRKLGIPFGRMEMKNRNGRVN